jgi:signal transduction histidine kinase
MVIAVVVIGLVAVADHVTGTQTIMEIFYLLPVLLVAWRVGFNPALVLGAAGATLTLVDDLLYGQFEHPAIPYWNAAAALATYAIAAEVVSLLHRTNDRLHASEAMRQDLTNMLVHDLKNPLVSAAMALEIYRRHQEQRGKETEKARQEQEELLRIAAESNERLRRLIEDILDVARADEAEMPLTLEKVDLVAVVREAVSAADPRARRAQLALTESYPPDPVQVRLDPGKIRRVVDNLLENAFKYTAADGHIEVRVQRRGNEALVSVADDGEGIPPGLQKHIFDKFGQAKAAREGQRMSVGLGLAFCKLAVERHGGRIWVESAPGDGATFTFALPLPN